MRYKIYWLLKCQLFYCVLSWWNLVFGQIRYSIPEELQLGSCVGNIADDLSLDIKQLSARRFRIVPGPRKQYVDINLESGILFVKEKIDREQICGSSLSCVISLNGLLENPLKLYQVEVEILDVNDNAPSFPKTQIRLEISEISTPETRFPLESAYDRDIGMNSVQTYELIPNDYFLLDVQMRSGERKLPVLVLQSSLDRETESSHMLTLIAKDGGVPVRSGTVKVTIIVKDANDNAPVFPQSVYRVSLLETAPTGTRVIILNATDLDDGPNGEITYSLSGHSSARVREVFDVDSKTGEIRLKGNLDYEEDKAFEINIQAMDKGPYAVLQHCDVLVDIIDVNDNAPELTLTSLSSTVSEDDPVGTVVALFSAADKDSGRNGQVQCQISNKMSFKLDSSLDEYYGLLVRHSLDRENASKYDVTITCTDSGNPPLTSKKTIRVEVSDVNDNAPRFTQSLYTASIMENNVIGASIFSITAFDPDVGQNARLKYSILETQVHNALISTYISINSETGDILAQRSFDYEKLKNFQIQAQVMDFGTPALASNVSVNVIILDQNDNVPVIVHPLAEYGKTTLETISRIAEPGYLVTKVSATDADAGQNARLSHSIFQATQHNLFTISPDSGEIWTVRRFANKDASKQRLVIVVKDNGTPSLSATVTIILSVVGGDTEIFSSISGSSEDAGFTPDLSLSLVIALGVISVIFLVILIILAVKVHKSRNALVDQHCSLSVCCCFGTRNSLNGIQKASRNLQIPPNYVEVFGGDPLSQSFRYESCSTLQSTKRDFITPNTCRSSTDKNSAQNESIRKEDMRVINFEKYSKPVNNEVRCFLKSDKSSQI
ncbi:protocadherin-10-like [Carcharodon carcharias]|uniref:protocadherin-10-like n=1 Tax=Carcharodon carcharias TaxID=13397 RepID=UPI001B7EB774|nr:protocadherin-10-like [Carcharodon carcharias]